MPYIVKMKIGKSKSTTMKSKGKPAQFRTINAARRFTKRHAELNFDAFFADKIKYRIVKV